MQAPLIFGALFVIIAIPILSRNSAQTGNLVSRFIAIVMAFRFGTFIGGFFNG